MSASTVPDKSSDGNIVATISNVRVDDSHRVRHKGIFDFNILAGQSHSEDWQIEQLSYQGSNVGSIMVGVRYHVVGGNDGDHITFSVVDIDNILGYGAGTILDTFADNFYVFPDEVAEIREHQADLIPGLYIRATYNNSGASDSRFVGNLLRYLKL